MLSREDILALERPTADVEIEGVGQFRMRALSAAEAIALGMMSGDSTGDQIEIVLARCLVDEGGKRLFDDSEADKLAQALPASALEPLLDRAMQLSGLAEVVEGFDEAQPDA